MESFNNYPTKFIISYCNAKVSKCITISDLFVNTRYYSLKIILYSLYVIKLPLISKENDPNSEIRDVLSKVQIPFSVKSFLLETQ